MIQFGGYGRVEPGVMPMNIRAIVQDRSFELDPGMCLKLGIFFACPDMQLPIDAGAS